MVVLDRAAWHCGFRVFEDGQLWPPGDAFSLAEYWRLRLLPPLKGLWDPCDRGRGQMGVHPLGRGGGLAGSCQAQLCPSAGGAADGAGGAVLVGAATTQADFRPFQAKTGDAGTGRVVDLL